MKSYSFDLVDLMRRIDGGELQIPDFRRDWVWSDEQIKSLVEGVVRGFPINSVMLLECGASTKFSCRPITGVAAAAAPSYLVLDEQQRLTSLFGALQSSAPVTLPNGDKRVYYIDMHKAVDSIKIPPMSMILAAEHDHEDFGFVHARQRVRRRTAPVNASIDQSCFSVNSISSTKIRFNAKARRCLRRAFSLISLIHFGNVDTGCLCQNSTEPQPPQFKSTAMLRSSLQASRHSVRRSEKFPPNEKPLPLCATGVLSL